jgi:hypothetical protein
MDSGQLRQQNGEEGRKQAFAAYPGIVHELEEPKVQR